MCKSIYILGTALSHDGSTCLMKDGEIIVAIEKERLSRIKHDGFNDNATIQYCLDAAGIGYQDLSLIVEQNSFNPLFSEQLTQRKNRVLPPHGSCCEHFTSFGSCLQRSWNITF